MEEGYKQRFLRVLDRKIVSVATLEDDGLTVRDFTRMFVKFADIEEARLKLVDVDLRFRQEDNEDVRRIAIQMYKYNIFVGKMYYSSVLSLETQGVLALIKRHGLTTFYYRFATLRGPAEQDEKIGWSLTNEFDFIA